MLLAVASYLCPLASALCFRKKPNYLYNVLGFATFLPCKYLPKYLLGSGLWPRTSSLSNRHFPSRSSTHLYPFQVLLPNPCTLSHKSSFIPRTCKTWNILPSSPFLESCNLSVFKSNINKLDLSLYLNLPFLFLPLLELHYRPKGLSLTSHTKKYGSSISRLSLQAMP